MDLISAYSKALDILEEHNLFDKGWCFRFDKATSRAGCCHYSKKIISASAPFCIINSEKEFIDTILHEVAHALCGPAAKHGIKWQEKFVSIGGTGKRVATHCIPVPKKLIGVCPNDDTHVYYRNKKVYGSCGRCTSSFDKSNTIVFMPNVEFLQIISKVDEFNMMLKRFKKSYVS